MLCYLKSVFLFLILIACLEGLNKKSPTVKISKRINSEELERTLAVWAEWVQSFTPGKQGRD